jgi:hypothetical protein
MGFDRIREEEAILGAVFEESDNKKLQEQARNSALTNEIHHIGEVNILCKNK